jgi:hypothetical protein
LLNQDDPNVAAAMTKPVTPSGLMSQVCAAISSHATALFVRGGVPGLRRVMPRVADRLPAGMEINEVTAEVMTALMEPLKFLSARGYLCTTGCERSNAARETVPKR